MNQSTCALAAASARASSNTDILSLPRLKQSIYYLSLGDYAHRAMLSSRALDKLRVPALILQNQHFAPSSLSLDVSPLSFTLMGNDIGMLSFLAKVQFTLSHSIHPNTCVHLPIDLEILRAASVFRAPDDGTR